MFVRRKQNKTGTTSVHVIDKSHGTYRVAKSFGVGYSEAEICRLEENGRQYILERQGLSNGLFEDEDEIKLEAFLSSNMYQLNYRLPNSKTVKNQILNLDKEQRELYEIVMKRDAL